MTHSHLVTVLILLLWMHALCDYPLQGDFLAKAKNRLSPIPGVPWSIAMASHCFTHAGAVFLITNSIILTVIEFISHFITDDMKCTNRINFPQDQSIHIAMKFLYVAALAYTVIP